MQQGSVVADFIDAFHVVRGQYNGRTLCFERLDFIHNELYVKWIKAREWFVENEHLRFALAAALLRPLSWAKKSK